MPREDASPRLAGQASERLDARLRNAKPSEKFLREQQARHQLRCEVCRDYARRRAARAAGSRKLERRFAAANDLTVSHRGERLYFMDCNGRIHVEEELSAEELIARWEARHAKDQGEGRKAHHD